MARPITLFTIQWGDLSLEEVCKLAKQMGFEGLELSAAHIDMRKAAVDKAYVEVCSWLRGHVPSPGSPVRLRYAS